MVINKEFDDGILFSLNWLKHKYRVRNHWTKQHNKVLSRFLNVFLAVKKASSLLFWGKMAKACAVTVAVFFCFSKKKKMTKVGTSGEKGKFVYLLLFAYFAFLLTEKKTNTLTHKNVMFLHILIKFYYNFFCFLPFCFILGIKMFNRI